MSRTTARLALTALTSLAVLPLVTVTAAAGASEPYDRVVDITFPVAGDFSLSDTYHAPRGGNSSECLEQGVEGRVHQAADIMADKMQRVVAAQSGVVTWAPETEPSYGWMISVRGDDGIDYHYVHLNNDTPGTDDGSGGIDHAYAPGVRKGVRVARGQHIGWVGDSGNAEGTAAHLHFEMEDPALDDDRLTCPLQSDRLDPHPSLEAALERGDVPDDAPVAGDGSYLGAPSGWIFADVWPEDTHAHAIEALVDAGVTHGCGDGSRFCPATEVRRDQMTSFVARAMDLLPSDATYPVGDVPEDATHGEAIAALLSRDIATLCGDDAFCPGESLTRADMAVWLAAALELSDGARTFDDVPADAPYAAAVAAIADVGVTTGCSATEFCPEDPVTRAQMASFLVRAFLGG